MKTNLQPASSSEVSRRQFLKSSTTLAVAAPFLASRALGAQGAMLRVGLIGCGGRGTGAAAQALQADSKTVLVAMSDAFKDRLQNGLEELKKQKDIAPRVNVSEEKCFIGFDASKQVIASGVDRKSLFPALHRLSEEAL
ncbi:MAG TPA: hypothetical protein VNZ22_18460 [Bacillota bacterium]|nr:hypothetical protein [Bacillota bacterium]